MMRARLARALGFLRVRSIRRQLITSVALVHAVLMLVLVLDLVTRQRESLHAEHMQRSTSLAQGLARQVASDLMAGDMAALQEAIIGVSDYPELRYAFLTDPAGRVLAHSDAERVGQYLADPLSISMLDGAHRPRVLLDSRHASDVAVPVLWQARLVGWVRFGVGMQSINRSLQAVVRDGVLYAGIAMLVGTLLAYWSARRVTVRLYYLLDVMQATRAGRRDVRARASGVDEIGRLADSFNAMLDALSEREQALARANEELETRVAQRTGELAASVAVQRAILEHANDAFVSMDRAGCITEWNRVAEATFGWRRDEAIGRTMAALLIPPVQREAHERGMARFLAHGTRVVVDQRVEVTALTRDGREIPVELSVQARAIDGGVHFDAFLRDITERKQLEHSLAQQALHDALTGLPNRRMLHESLPTALARAERAGKPLALLFLDLDRFKHINDTLGHEAGDRVLCEFARRIRGAVRGVDTVVRLAGDEFVVVCEALADGEPDALRIAGKILVAASAPYALDDRLEALSTSVGIALYRPGDATAPDTLMLRADQAMYASKRRGRGAAMLWTADAAGHAPAVVG